MSGGRVVFVAFGIVAAEHALQIFGVLELAFDDRGGVGIRHHILLEPEIVRENVIDQTAEKGDVGSGADADEHIRNGGRAREAGINMQNLAALRFGLHGEAEADRMRFGHVAAHDQDAVAIGQVF